MEPKLLPGIGFNINSAGTGPIPTFMPNGSEILSRTNSSITYRTPEGEEKTWEGDTDGALRNMYGNFNQASAFGALRYKNEDGLLVDKSGQLINPNGEATTTTFAVSFDGSSKPTFSRTSAATGSEASDSNSSTSNTGSGVQLGDTEVDNTTNVPDASQPQIDDTVLRESDEFKSLSEDQQAAVLQVYQAIAENNTDQAERLAAAFKTAAGISDPFFKQELRMAVDALERGFVSIDQEEEYRARQLKQNQQDLVQDLQTNRDSLSFDEQAALRQIERQYSQDLKNVRQSMAATGKSFSSERAETEGLLEEATGDLRESTTRRFGVENLKLDRTEERTNRDTTQELERLAQLSKDKRTDLFREGEAKVGTKNLPTLSGTGNADPLGDIVGDIPQRQIADITAGAQNLIF